MSYTRKVGDLTVDVVCASDPDTNYALYYAEIERAIRQMNYMPQTSMENLISMAVLHFDCDDNYGEYDPETGCGGYGDSFTMDGLLMYVDDCNGWHDKIRV